MRSRAVFAHVLAAGTRWQSAFVAVLAVVSVIVGLMTMHSMAGSAGHHQGTTSSATQSAAEHGDVTGGHPVAGAHAVADHYEQPASAVPCDAACQMGCLMVGVLCTLALLAVMIAFLLPRRASAMLAVRDHTNRVLNLLAAAAAPPRPPSLTALSISRT
jgi:hypothetical protein